MKHASFLSGCKALSVTALLGTLALAGCGGALDLPDAVPSSQAAGPAIQGTVYGGHAPIQGAHVYLLQPGVTGYGSAATSILGNNGATSSGGYAITANVSDPNVPATAGTGGTEPKYVTTDANGAFNLTGAYTCTINQPVYIYAYGGNIGTTTGTTPVTVTITKASFTEEGNSGRYTVTFTATNTLTAGTALTFAGLTGGYAQLNGTTQNVIAPVTGTTFTIFFTGTRGSLSGSTTGTATYTTTGSIPPTQNNNIVQLATLGNCPTSGNFSTAGNGALSYVYLNEVSTVATAYTFQPFTSAANNNAWDIGSSGTTQALLGIANAANTAAQLYAIQGNGQASTTVDGEGHIANLQTQLNGAPNHGNGSVPQQTIDSLADILAACVDSVPSTVGTPTTQCSALFSVATDNGETTGTQPTDTGTAAINIARYPAGNSSAGTANVDATYAKDIFNVPTGTVPYTPNLSSSPNDWTIAITYSNTQNADINNPESIAIDNAGNVFVSNQGGFTNPNAGGITKMLPSGTIASNYSATLPGYLSVDSSNNVWFGSINANTGITELTNAGVFKAQSPVAIFDVVSAAATDSFGNFYFVSATSGNANINANAYEYTSTFGSPAYSPFTGSATCTPNYSGYNGYDHLAIDGSQTLWVSDEHSNQVCRFSTTGTVYSNKYPITTGTFPEAISIDNSGSAWVSLQTANQVDHITITAGVPTTTTLTSASTGATFSAPFSTTVDGAGHIWITNRSSSTISELTNAGKAISPASNYQSGGVLNDPLNAAIDPSGNVWITNYDGQKVVELVGAATPVVTPLSFASGSGGLGKTP